ncbi:MAG: hypothetical protein DCC75_11930 [Proteobacteria bacterium]|nr:MAG: hypothetical protein DCC75_11930 [Pseudomonadota bacterium]
MVSLVSHNSISYISISDMHCFGTIKASILTLALVIYGTLAHATDEIEEFPQMGLLAASGSLPSNSVSLPLPVGMKPGQTAPITGGLSRGEKGICSYSVTNNFDKPIRISLSVRQYTASLQKTTSSPASFRLKPSETQSGQVKEQANTAGCALIMESWKFQPQ